MTKIVGIIPSRYASTRFPAKPLAKIGGKSMIQRVYEQCKKANSLTQVVVATDHEAIANEVKSFGGAVVMTAESHPSGTDRCHEAYQALGEAFDYIINIQGDEPFIQPEQIDLLADLLQDKQVEIGTLVNPVESWEDFHNPNVVTVTKNVRDEAMYFSRSPIPFYRNSDDLAVWLKQHDYFRHVGIYAYRADILAELTQLEQSSLEKAESLEQLRWLENGYKIKVGVSPYKSMGVDTPEDLEKAEELLNG
ncbi:MAG: 3-deoxy-manno-octulosonate cytidylyltransferase [Flammeovirgaceae bacterium]